MTNGAKKPDPMTVTQERALRFIAGITDPKNQHYVQRTVNRRTLVALIERGLIVVTREGGRAIHTVTEEGKAIVAAGGPVA